MLTSCRNIELGERGGDLGAGACHDHHDVGVSSKHVDERGELRVSHFHASKLALGFRATDLKLLDDVGDAFEAVAIVVFRAVTV